MTNKQQKPQKQNNALQKMRKKVLIQAIIAIQTIVITVALIFGMSAAWYTNVLQTSGLQFQAAAWGFTGEVLVETEPTQASPGDTGFVGLQVTNTGDDVVEVAVQVSKTQMEAAMQQRFFLYVDTAKVQNGEVMDRVYINTRDSYTYSILSRGELVLTEERSNDVQLKWQWVYDMLGYYFVGTVSQTTENGQDNIVVDVDDYLRPVEYDLDKAGFTDGMLATVDGVPVEDFIASLSLKDGYINNIDYETEIPGYYRVDVDEQGHGIWVHLCSWAEIQQATTYDSQLGKEAADAFLGNGEARNFTARLSVIGQEPQTEYKEVTDAAQLSARLQLGELVQLQQNIVLDQPLVLDAGIRTVLDLNGFTITGASGAPLLQMRDSSHLTIMNGHIIAQDSSQDVIRTQNSTLTLSGVTISGDGDDAIDIDDRNSGVDSRIRLFDCNVDVNGCAVFIRGNGTVSGTKTQIIVENSTLNSGYIAIMGNGTTTLWGTEVQVYRSTVHGYYAAVYQPQGDSVMKITESDMSGRTGIVLKGGDLEVRDSKILGTAPWKEPVSVQSGFDDTGDAIFIDCGYSLPVKVSIFGECRIISDNNLPLRVLVPEGKLDLTTVSITGGTFEWSESLTWEFDTFVAEGYQFDISISGGRATAKLVKAQNVPTETTDDADSDGEEGAGDA